MNVADAEEGREPERRIGAEQEWRVTWPPPGETYRYLGGVAVVTQSPDPDAQFVLVTWHGPFGYDKKGLRRSRIDPGGPVGADLRGLRGKSGVYLVIGDHPTCGARALLYIGRTNRFERRLNDEHEWIADEWRVEVYLGTLSDASALNDVESLLIHAHSPPYCTKCIGSCTRAGHLRVWNDGRFWGLFPEVSSKHPWYPTIVVLRDSRYQGCQPEQRLGGIL